MTSGNGKTTARLLSRAREGDREALNELFDAHTQRLLDVVRNELGERARRRLESQDVMQEVYLDAVRGIDQFVERGSDSFLAWLRRIAVNRICDVDRRNFKTQKRGPEMRVGDLGVNASMMGLLEAVSPSISTPSRVAGRADQIRLLNRALSKLADDHRTVIQYRYFQQLSVQETAEKMDRSDRAVRALCVRALIRLRELLADVV